MLKVKTHAGWYQSRIYRRPSDVWYSSSQGDIPIDSMNNHHLQNAIKSIEVSAQKELEYIQNKHPDLYAVLRNWNKARLAEYLCPIYRNLVQNLNRRKTPTLPSKAQNNISGVDETQLNTIIQNAVTSVLSQLQTTAKQPTVVTDLEVLAKKKVVAHLVFPTSSVENRIWNILSDAGINNTDDLSKFSFSGLLLLDGMTPKLAEALFNSIIDARIDLSGNECVSCLMLFQYDESSREAANQYTDRTLEVLIDEASMLFNRAFIGQFQRFHLVLFHV